MDFDTAREFVLRQTTQLDPNRTDAFIVHLRQGKPPVPGQVTSLLLALKVLFEGLRQEPTLDRTLVAALLILAYESRQLFDAGVVAGVAWPPLLNDDLVRIAKAVTSIVVDDWQA